jgi:hypothetical protein
VPAPSWLKERFLRSEDGDAGGDPVDEAAAAVLQGSSAEDHLQVAAGQVQPADQRVRHDGHLVGECVHDARRHRSPASAVANTTGACTHRSSSRTAPVRTAIATSSDRRIP